MFLEPLKTRIAGEISLSQDPGTTMRKWREVFNISQTELARVLKITSSTISDYEGNRRKSPGIGVVRRFVDAIVEMDLQRGGELIKRFREAEAPQDFFTAISFPRAVNGNEFCRAIGGKALACESKLPQLSLYGCTIIDSLKVILELPYESFMKIYSTTTQRALLFTTVSTGRSPMVAIRVSPIKPALVVMHGLKPEKADKLAVRIAESEGIPLVVTSEPIDVLTDKLKAI